MCVLYNVMCERPCDPLTSIPLQELLVNPATSLRLICQTAECRLPVIGACYRFMGVDEKVGSTDESEDVWESIHLSGAPVTGRGRKGGGGGTSLVNKHIFMYGFPKRSATTGLINSQQRSQSFFSHLTPAHMAWQWLSHHLRRNREAVTAP